MSEPYTIIDSNTRKTIKQLVNLEQIIAELWERRGRGENVELIGDLHSNERRSWTQPGDEHYQEHVVQSEPTILAAA